ncbi:ROK family transcriptional regulator [Pontibacillus chungwhensis BH030062]|uniref:ROK family transcriptional regulator n=1 Tax=Pontibacillus chungwhensis BH030062 TaxID=1385513 RepID=A0A0A2UV10_9BACI|nr:ROK family transcriptional regulator [Pontibacillus chungwhensis]KGP91759.1 ROK family transcriptional regulator [Pontibacillus chungwhensis BH030062]
MSTKYTRGSFQLMKSINRSVILNMIRSKGPISRADIAKQTNLTPPTVSNIVKELLDSQFVVETTQGSSQGGRKPTYLEINANQFFIMGIDVGRYHIKFVITNLYGELVEQLMLDIQAQPEANDLIEKMKEGIYQIMQKGGRNKDKYLGIGVAMHGIVDVNTGVSLFAPSFQTHNIPIQEELAKEFSMMVHVENDAKAMTLGEWWLGNGNDEDNIVGINVGHGIGAGIMIRGELFQGANFIAGEIGHMTIDLSGPKCSCGNYGCLQTLAAGPAIAQRAIKELKAGNTSMITDIVQGDLERVNGEIVFEAATRGDEFSQELLKQTGRYLGIGLTNLIHTINPNRIIIGGGVSHAGEFILDSLQETIQARIITDAAKETEIVPSQLGDNASAIGACVLILQNFFHGGKQVSQ